MFIIWNFNNPLTFVASLIWNSSEFLGIGLGWFAPYIFGVIIECKKKGKLK